jgi:hypothetical protein
LSRVLSVLGSADNAALFLLRDPYPYRTAMRNRT